MATRGWNTKAASGAIVDVMWKQFDDGLYVEVSVEKVPEGFVVKTLAESRTSGPNEVLSGRLGTMAEAIDVAAKERKNWDDDAGELDLSALRSV